MRKLGYAPGKSLVHRLYPITKFVWLLLASITLFLLNKSWLIIVTAFLFFAVLIFIHPDIWEIRGFRLAVSTSMILMFLYLLFEKSGDPLLFANSSILKITTGGVEMGLKIGGRFLAIIFLSYIFILTTQPNQLAYGLMKMGVPYRYGFMLVTALRLAPTLEMEGQTIYQAQLVRGVRYDKKNIKKLLHLVRQFLTPLLFSALRKADKLVFSMEGRGFGKYPKRTFLDQTSPCYRDILVSIGLLLFFLSLLILNYGGVV